MEFDGFDWDLGNAEKCMKHGVLPEVIEGIFDGAIAVFPDEAHSKAEQRLRAIGRAADGRYIFVVFTLRRKSGAVIIRPISARYMHAKEVRNYEGKASDL